MANAGITVVLDNMNLMANVDNKKCIEELRKKILKLMDRLEKLETDRLLLVIRRFAAILNLVANRISMFLPESFGGSSRYPSPYDCQPIVAQINVPRRGRTNGSSIERDF
jgi:hypothetical protein